MTSEQRRLAMHLDQLVRRRRLYALMFFAAVMMTVALLVQLVVNEQLPLECEITVARDGTYTTSIDNDTQVWPPPCAPSIIWKETPS